MSTIQAKKCIFCHVHSLGELKDVCVEICVYDYVSRSDFLMSCTYHCYIPLTGCGYIIPSQAGGQSLYNSGILVGVGQPHSSSGVFGLDHFIT